MVTLSRTPATMTAKWNKLKNRRTENRNSGHEKMTKMGKT
jgi:hypothetical protein